MSNFFLLQPLFLFIHLQISSKDMIHTRNANVEKYLTFEQVVEGNVTTGYVWKVDGMIRTVRSMLPIDINNLNELSLDTQYRIENRKVRASYSDCVGKSCSFVFVFM